MRPALRAVELVAGLEAFEHSYARGLRERDRRFGHRRIDERAHPHECHRAPYRRELTIEDWEKIGYDMPLLVNMQPAGDYLGEEYYRAGGLPAVMPNCSGQAHPRRRADVNGRTMGENVSSAQRTNAESSALSHP